MQVVGAQNDAIRHRQTGMRRVAFTHAAVPHANERPHAVGNRLCPLQCLSRP